MTPHESALPIWRLEKLVRLDVESGRLFWLARTPDMFPPSSGRAVEHVSANWNSRMAGKEALAAPKGGGYRHGSIFGSHFLAHRVVFALSNGRWPNHQVDHINGDPSDNRPSNLRDATRIENSRNMAISSRNSSGEVGVSWSNKELKWISTIVISGENKRIGSFVDFQEAVAARKQVERNAGFHPNHGRA